MNSPHEIMLKFLFLLIMFIIIFIIFNKNISPLNLMMILLMFTIIILLMNYLINQKSLYCFMIFISMISGNMIMFLYFTSLINNYYNKSFKSITNYLFMFKILLILISIIYFLTPTLKMKYNSFTMMSMFKIYTYPLYFITLMMILYLLLTLLFSMKICLFKYKPLRKIYN
uniref:NADH dehydrogenase subunit 6 n=1 Tax=Lasioglossum pauxillum TaxID=88516 RepID=A0A0S2LSV1_LASPU|nr:NADH dehydrogenase subunit 6 [Lasioglossum pauxillum]